MQLLETTEGLFNDNAFSIEINKAWRIALYFRTRIVGEVLIGGATITLNFGLWQGQPFKYLAAICLDAFSGQRSLSLRRFASLNIPLGIISRPAWHMRCPLGE